MSLELDHDPKALTTTQTTNNEDADNAIVPALPTAAAAAAAGGLLDSPRHAAAAAAQRYPYDLTNKELDAHWQAKRALQDVSGGRGPAMEREENTINGEGSDWRCMRQEEGQWPWGGMGSQGQSTVRAGVSPR